MSNKLAITLDLFYGMPSYNAKGQVISRKEPVKLIYKSVEWDNFMQHLAVSDIQKADVVKIYDLAKEEEVENDEIQKEVDVFFKEKEIPLTNEQKQIKELQEQIKQLTEATKTKAPVKKVDETTK